MSDVYLILNETTFTGTDSVTTEVVAVFETLQSALDDIAEIADDNGVFVEDDANSVVLLGKYGTGIATDEYYIVEIELK